MPTSKLSTETTSTKRAPTDKLSNPRKRVVKYGDMRKSSVLQLGDDPFHSGDDSDLAVTEAEEELNQKPEAGVLPLASSVSTDAPSEMDTIVAIRNAIRGQMLDKLPRVSVDCREFSKTDVLLQPYKGKNVKEKLEAFVKQFAEKDTSAAAMDKTCDTLYLVLTSESAKYTDLQSFLKYVKKEKWFNVMGELCENVFGLEHNGDKKREVRIFLELWFNALRKLAVVVH